MSQRHPLTFPISFEESLEALQDQLKKLLKICFSEAGLKLSNNGYISIQIFEFPYTASGISDPIVKYLSTDQFRLYPESNRRLRAIINSLKREKLEPRDILREASRTIIGISDQEIQSVNERLMSPKSREQFEDTVASLIQTIDDYLLSYPAMKPPTPFDVADILKRCLQKLEQPLSIGIAPEVFTSLQIVEVPPKPIVHPDITKRQVESIEESRAPELHKARYQLITNIEKYFFVGGIKESNTSDLKTSLVAFAPLSCYGQRAGYLFVIESYLTEGEGRQKQNIVTSFLKDQMIISESYIKGVKEGKFLHEIGEDILRSSDYSDETFISSVIKNLGIVINQLEVKFTKHGKEESHPKKRIHKNRQQTLLIPVRVKEGVFSKYLGQLAIRLDQHDADALWRQANRRAFLDALSKGLELIRLNRRIQEKERDARWKDIFRKLWHNTQFHLAGALHTASKLEARVAELTPFDPQLRPTEYLHDLRYILELSRFVDNPSEYVYERDTNRRIRYPEDVDLVSIIKEIKEYILIEIKYNDGWALRLPSRKIYEAILAAAERCDEGHLFNIEFNDPVIIRSYPEVIGVIIKDILVNAASNAINKKALESGCYPKVTIKLSKDSNGAGNVFIVRNESGISREAYSIWENGEVPLSSTLHNPQGILICRNYLEWLGYKYHIPKECIREGGGAFTQINIWFDYEPIEFLRWKESENVPATKDIMGRG